MYFDGRFIPARMLVNGGSIAYDHSFSRYDYYHIETADHSVIFAESMPTESYLDILVTAQRSAKLEMSFPSRNACCGIGGWMPPHRC
ncbi:Hint domain-containing protein [Kozakia baliensis]|uniref:Hint domain-containing protein n=1 Tax=Kozakia baliensis TaxID=153496 RepID=UPI00345BA8D5